MWNELVCVLQKILSAYEELFLLSEKKGIALRNVAIQDMETIVRQEQTLLKEINKLEKTRTAVSYKIAQTEKLPMHKLSDAIESADAAMAEELKRVQTALPEVLRKITVKGKENDALTRQSLELMCYKTNILAETKVEPTYAEGGRENITAAKWLDYKA